MKLKMSVEPSRIKEISLPDATGYPLGWWSFPGELLNFPDVVVVEIGCICEGGFWDELEVMYHHQEL